MAAKLVLPTQVHEGQSGMKAYYFSQLPVLFLIIAVSAALSFLFNIWLLDVKWWQQLHIVAFIGLCLYMWYKKPVRPWIHQILAMLVTASVIIAMCLEQKNWTLA